MKIFRTSSLLTVLAISLISTSGFSQQQQTDKNDKTGINPINFQRDIRVYNEYSWLNTQGDGTQSLTTVEFRDPVLQGQVTFQTSRMGAATWICCAAQYG
jgi:hypothetical protein